MPTYDYECTQCGRMFEEFQSITAAPKRRLTVDCEKCHNKAPVRRCIGKGAGVIFKGSGFFETDYRSADYKKKAEAEKKAGQKKSESKADAGKKSGTGSTKSAESKSDGAGGAKKTDD